MDCETSNGGARVKMDWLLGAVWLNVNTDRLNLNCNYNPINNNGRFRRMALAALDTYTRMKTYNKLYSKLCSIENLELAFRKARKRKSSRPYVQEFEQNLQENLKELHCELSAETYRPLPLITFILRDPKTRKISVSDFRDRIVHHALCNVIEPIFEKRFIYDSYANRKGKGTSAALRRFHQFKRKTSKNGSKVDEKFNNNYVCGYILKADVRHYFDAVDHKVLLNIISRKIGDEKVMRLIGKILANHKTTQQGKGMPLGNLTSQFFANIYLNELDYYVKHSLKAKCYLRYVDDFVIFHESREALERYKEQINCFLQEKLRLELHPDKSKIKPLAKGLDFVGYRIFYYFTLLRKRNIKKIDSKLREIEDLYKNRLIYKETIDAILNGWFGYMNGSNTFKLQQKILKRIDHL